MGMKCIFIKSIEKEKGSEADNDKRGRNSTECYFFPFNTKHCHCLSGVVSILV